jgi:hypothetical protein
MKVNVAGAGINIAQRAMASSSSTLLINKPRKDNRFPA